MRPTPVILALLGTPPKPLVKLQPERIEVQHKINAIPSARLVLSVEGDALEELIKYQAEIALCSAGQPVEVWLQEPTADRHLVFRGVITQQSLRMTRSRTELTLLLKHDLQKLQNTRRSQLFEEQTDAAILRTLLQEQRIPLLGLSGMDTAHDQLIQFRCSDWQFIRYRLLANGTWLFPTPEGVTVTPPVVAPKALYTLQQKLLSGAGQLPIEEARWRFSVQELPAALVATSWSDDTQQADPQPAIPTPLGDQAFESTRGRTLNATTWEFNYSSSLGMAETRRLANSLLTNIEAARATGEYLLDGTIRFQLGQTIGVEGYGASFDGLGIVTGIQQHVGKDSGWRTLIMLGHQDALLDMAGMPRATGLHIGVVAPFKEDMTGMGRLQVRLPVLGATNNVVWARLAKPYASAMSGFCFYPEEGDEVVVGFFDEDPSYPVIVGSMHNPMNPPPVTPDALNAVKALVVNKNERQFQFKIDTQQNQLTIDGADETLSFHDGVSLRSQTQMTLKAKELKLTSDQSTLEGVTQVTVQGAEINLSH